MIRACLFLLAGVYAPQLSSFALDSDPIAIVLFTFLAGLLFGRLRDAIFLVAGAAVFLLATFNIINARISPDFVGDSIVTQVRIVDFPRHSGLNVNLVAEAQGNPWVPRRLRISWYEPDVQIRLGDTWQLELRLRRPRGNSNPGVFDYEAWLLRERVGAVAYVVDGRRNHLLRSGDLHPVERLRQRVVNRITLVIPDAERAAVLAAISVGARHLVTPQQWDRYARTGASHLMAISGLHVGLAAAGGYFLMAVLVGLSRRRGDQHSVATLAALSVAGSYALLSGLAVPAERAGLMIGIAVVSVLCRRQVQPFTVVATACALIIVSAPLATLAPGFKLSFSAVLVLIWLARRYPGHFESHRMLRPLAAVRQLGAMQVMLLCGLLPLTVLIFGRLTFAAPVVNLIAVPVFSFVTVPFTLAGLILDGSFQPLGDWALTVAAGSLTVIETLIAKSAQLPGASVAIPTVTGAALLLVFAPLVWAVFPPGWPGRNVAWIGVVALTLSQPPRPPSGCADIDVLDVGQGLAIVITTRQHVVVFDTGPAFRGGGSAAESVLLPFLAGRGIDRVDKLIVSHADLDHSGGVDTLLDRIDVLDARVGEPLSATRQFGRDCVAGEDWRYDSIGFAFIHPPPDSLRTGNDSSCVLMVSAGTRRMLFTGDIEQPVEERLVRSGDLLRVDAVSIPHHGSLTSSSAPFVQALRPAIAIVSAGYGNRWGLPKEKVVDRWSAAGATVFTTATSGAISLRLCENVGVSSLTHHRAARRRIWHE
jgi:competence protein ComEC